MGLSSAPLQQLDADRLRMWRLAEIRGAAAAPIIEKSRAQRQREIARIAPHRGRGRGRHQLERCPSVGVVEPDPLGFGGSPAEALGIHPVGKGLGAAFIAQRVEGD